MKTKLLKKHSKDCCALKAVARGDWATPWYLNTYQPLVCFLADTLCRIRTDKLRGTYRWIKLRCNDPACEAELAMRVNVIEELANFLV